MTGTGPTCHLCRLQHSVTLLQQQSEEQRLLLQTLRAELHVYESLPGPSAETRAGMGPVCGIPAHLLPLGDLAPLQPLGGPRHFSWGSRLHPVALLAGREGGRDGGQDPSNHRQGATSTYRGSDISCSRLLPISSSARCWH